MAGRLCALGKWRENFARLAMAEKFCALGNGGKVLRAWQWRENSLRLVVVGLLHACRACNFSLLIGKEMLGKEKHFGLTCTETSFLLIPTGSILCRDTLRSETTKGNKIMSFARGYIMSVVKLILKQ